MFLHGGCVEQSIRCNHVGTLCTMLLQKLQRSGKSFGWRHLSSRRNPPKIRMWEMQQQSQHLDTRHGLSAMWRQHDPQQGRRFLLKEKAVHSTWTAFVGATGFEPATPRPPDVYSNRAELCPEIFANVIKFQHKITYRNSVSSTHKQVSRLLSFDNFFRKFPNWRYILPKGVIPVFSRWPSR